MIFTAILFCVFLVSGTAKLFGMTQFIGTVSQLGFARAWGRALAWIVVLSEVAVSVCLCFPASLTPGILLAGLLLAAFYWAHYRSRRQAEPVPCNCFGSMRRDTLSAKTLYRVIALSLVWIGAWFGSEPIGVWIREITIY